MNGEWEEGGGVLKEKEDNPQRGPPGRSNCCSFQAIQGLAGKRSRRKRSFSSAGVQYGRLSTRTAGYERVLTRGRSAHEGGERANPPSGFERITPGLSLAAPTGTHEGTFHDEGGGRGEER